MSELKFTRKSEQLTGEPSEGAEQVEKPKRTRAPNKKKSDKSDVSGLTSALVNIHALLAGMTQIPEIAIEREQAEVLATAASEVMQHYDFGMNAEQQAWVNLMMVAGSIYGSKVFAYKIRKSQETEEGEPTA
jgi:hypothetical protein